MLYMAVIKFRMLSKLFKNKYFLVLLLVVNSILFGIGFVLSDLDIMLIAVMSYGLVLLGMKINTDFSE